MESVAEHIQSPPEPAVPLRRHTIKPLVAWLVTGGTSATLFAIDLLAVKSGVSTRTDRSLDLAIHHQFGLATFNAFSLISDMGNGSVRTALIGFLVFALLLGHRWRSAAVVTSAMAGGALLNIVVKDVVARPRPHLFVGALSAGGYSFPSGHAMSTTLLCGVLIYLAWILGGRTWFVAAVAAICLLVSGMVCLSRIVLGVHYPTDVIGGLLLGVAWLSCIFPGVLMVERAISRRATT